MSRIARLILGLIVGLALLAWAASGVVETTAREWFERDVSIRAHLALHGSSRSIAQAWDDPQELHTQLLSIAHDERVIGVAACGADLQPRAASPGFPDEFSCAEVGSRILSADPCPRRRPPSSVNGAPSASCPPAASRSTPRPSSRHGQDLGFVVLVQDLSYIDAREARARTFLIVIFALLALTAFGVPLIAARRARYEWSLEFRRLLRGEGRRTREFQPILSDMRQLLGRMATEQGDTSGPWSAASLKQTLTRLLHGEKIVILANREPYIHERMPDGSVEVQHPASGLVTALEPVLRACSGIWVAHGSGSADRETVDAHDRVAVPPGEESYQTRRVWLSDDELQGYYYGFANEGLWPLCHVAHARPVFRSADWRHYREVNQKFADVVCSEVDSRDPIILVQDYHFALAPAMIRRRLPRATVITFWHIPWPNAERMGICPWRNEILQGLLGSSILGFHTQLFCNNFFESVDRYLETRIDRENNAVVMQGHSTLVRPYPIAIEWPSHWADSAPSPEDCRAQVFRDWGLKPDALLGVGVDRLDYTKGIEERLLAVELLLERYPEFRGRFTFAQLAAPSRTQIPRYRELNETIEILAARINERFGYQRLLAHPPPPLPPRAAGGLPLLSRRRRLLRLQPPRRHEPRRQGIRRRPQRPQRRPRPQRVHRRRPRAH